MFSPDWFIKEQISHSAAAVSTDNSRLVAQQLGNAYCLLFMVGVAVLYTTNELKVVRNYLVALWLADIGHVLVTYFTLGHDRFVAVGQWNAMTWGNVGFTVGAAVGSWCLLSQLTSAPGFPLSGPDGVPLGSVRPRQAVDNGWQKELMIGTRRLYGDADEEEP